MKEILRQKALELGFDECRFTTAEPPPHAKEFRQWLAEGRHGTMGYLERNADKRVSPEQVLAGAKSVMVLVASYHAPGAEAKRGEAQIARYARFADYHEVLGERLRQLVGFMEAEAPGTKSLWYVDTGPLLERDLAQRAGVGFIGKHTNLISRRLGNWFFICEIITTLELEGDVSEPNRCGHCTRCLVACPTQAITAPFQLDARKCISYLTIELKGSIPEELRPAIGTRIYGCDDCLAACPWNRFAQEGRLMAAHRRAELDAPGLIELLGLDDAAFKQKFRGSPILRTKRRGLLRNVCVALGNLGDRAAVPALEKAAADSEPLIAEHAWWALKRIKDLALSGDVIE